MELAAKDSMGGVRMEGKAMTPPEAQPSAEFPFLSQGLGILGLLFFSRVIFMRAWPPTSLWELAWRSQIWTLAICLCLGLILFKRGLPARDGGAWPWTGVLALGLTLWALAPSGALYQTWARLEGLRMSPWEALALFGLACVLLTVFVPKDWKATALACAFVFQQAFASMDHPLAWQRSDMLINLDYWARLWLGGLDPYAHATPRGLAPSYLPGLILWQAPSAWGLLDPRAIPILMGGLALGLLGCRPLRMGPWALLGGAGVFLGPYLFSRDDIYVQPLWLLAGISLWAAARNRWLLCGASWGLALSCREWFWILLPLWAHLPCRPGDRAKAWLAAAAGLVLPWIGVMGWRLEPAFEMVAARREGYLGLPLKTALARTLDFGWAWLPQLISQGRLELFFGAVTCALITLYLWKKIRHPGHTALAMGLGLASFQLFIPQVEPYHFLLSAYFLIWAACYPSGEKNPGESYPQGARRKS